MKVKELKFLINKFPDDTDIKINYVYKNHGYLKEIEGVNKIIDQDTNKGCCAIYCVSENTRDFSHGMNRLHMLLKYSK